MKEIVLDLSVGVRQGLIYRDSQFKQHIKSKTHKDL